MLAHKEARPRGYPRAGLNRRGLAYALPGILNPPPIVVPYDPGHPGIVFCGVVRLLRYHPPPTRLADPPEPIPYGFPGFRVYRCRLARVDPNPYFPGRLQPADFQIRSTPGAVDNGARIIVGNLYFLTCPDDSRVSMSPVDLHPDT